MKFKVIELLTQLKIFFPGAIAIYSYYSATRDINITSNICCSTILIVHTNKCTWLEKSMRTDFSFQMSKAWGVYFCSLTFWKQENLLFSNILANSSTGSPSGKWVPPSLQKKKVTFGCCTFGTSQVPFKIATGCPKKI